MCIRTVMHKCMVPRSPTLPYLALHLHSLNVNRTLSSLPNDQILTPDVLHLKLSDSESATERYAALFAKYRLLHFCNVTPTTPKGKRSFTWSDIGSLFGGLNDKDRESWCVETKGEKAIAPVKFLKSDSSKDRAYCSFLVQHTQNAYNDTLAQLPLTDLPWLASKYEHALWIFFGRNPKSMTDLAGRPEHTDSVSHDGTWHYQLSGRKRWFLKPTEAFLNKIDPDSYLHVIQETGICVECNEGDVLVLE
jgi:hypothetical protein